MRIRSLISAALVLGCGDSLEPVDVVGSYGLVTIRGHIPPRIVHDDPECRITVVDGNLTLTSDQRFDLLLEELWECPPPSAPGGHGWFGTYDLSGETVVLHAVGDPSVDFHGRYRSGRLVVPLGEPYGEVAFAPGE